MTANLKRYSLPFIASALVLYLHIIGMNNFLYWHFWWYDVMMHFIGGFAIASFFFIFTNNWKRSFVAMLFVAIGWEIFEYLFNIEVLEGLKYTLDTIKDLCMDSLGAFLAIYINKKR